MTKNSAEKRAARAYARSNDVSYRQAIGAVRRDSLSDDADVAFIHRVLIEAVEGCGIRHWAEVLEWDGVSRAIVRDVGGEVFSLTSATLAAAVRRYRTSNPTSAPLEMDSYLADEIVQSALFDIVIYRLRRRR